MQCPVNTSLVINNSRGLTTLDKTLDKNYLYIFLYFPVIHNSITFRKYTLLAFHVVDNGRKAKFFLLTLLKYFEQIHSRIQDGKQQQRQLLQDSLGRSKRKRSGSTG